MFVPAPPPPPSPQTRELAHRIAQTIREYRVENPGIQSGEVVRALGVARQLLRPELGGSGPERQVVVGVLVALLLVGAALAFKLAGGGLGPLALLVLVGLVAVALLAVLRAGGKT